LLFSHPWSCHLFGLKHLQLSKEDCHHDRISTSMTRQPSSTFSLVTHTQDSRFDCNDRPLGLLDTMVVLFCHGVVHDTTVICKYQCYDLNDQNDSSYNASVLQSTPQHLPSGFIWWGRQSQASPLCFAIANRSYGSKLSNNMVLVSQEAFQGHKTFTHDSVTGTLNNCVSSLASSLNTKKSHREWQSHWRLRLIHSILKMRFSISRWCLTGTQDLHSMTEA